MESNSLVAIMILAFGGLASASFYAPLKLVKWKWEIMWTFYAIFALLVVPNVVAPIVMPSCWEAIGQTEGKTLFLTFLFGALWGIGGLTFGLSMRYLGIGLGTAVALGCCALVGTLVDPFIAGNADIYASKAGFIILLGVFICGLGIAINGVAGMLKEKDTASDEAPQTEFNLVKGLSEAVMAGVLSACFAISLSFGAPIAKTAFGLAVDAGMEKETADLFMETPVLIVTLFGGFLVNFFWCLFLAIKNNSFGDFKAHATSTNGVFLVLCLLGSALWYTQFFLLGVGKSYMPEEMKFVSWGILMSFVIVFAGIIGLMFGEWKGTAKITKSVLWLGILVLVSSTFVMTL